MDNREWYGEFKASYREQREAYLALSKDMSLQQIIEAIINGNNDMIFNFIEYEQIKKIGNKQRYSAPLHKRQEIDGQLAIVALEFFQQYKYDPYSWNIDEFLLEYSRFCRNRIRKIWYWENGGNQINPEIPFQVDHGIFTDTKQTIKDYHKENGYDEPLNKSVKYDPDFNERNIVKDFQELITTNMDLKEALRTLTNKEKEVIYYLYFLELTQEEIAKRLNTYQKEVSRIKIQALEKLRKNMKVNKNNL